jgi:hypothetical protein
MHGISSGYGYARREGGKRARASGMWLRIAGLEVGEKWDGGRRRGGCRIVFVCVYTILIYGDEIHLGSGESQEE